MMWRPPSIGWLKLNTDGASKVSSAYVVELWGVYEGLRLGKELSVARLELELGSSVITDSLITLRLGNGEGAALLNQIKILWLKG